jgi:HTH-type transcriptional regulator / antitoxin MqsA
MRGGSKCTLCKKGSLKRKVIDETFSYKGKKITIHNFVIFECDYCEDEIVAPESLKSSRKVLKDHQRRVDGLLTSSEIKGIREKLDRKQEEFAKLLGMSVKTFTRYENGYVTQSRSVDKQIRLLNYLFDNYPHALEFLTQQKEEKIEKPSVVVAMGKYKTSPEQNYKIDAVNPPIHQGEYGEKWQKVAVG